MPDSTPWRWSRSCVLEERFDFEIDDEDFTGEVFETIGTLAEFVEATVP